jgi:hypothetical protein
MLPDELVERDVAHVALVDVVGESVLARDG